MDEVLWWSDLDVCPGPGKGASTGDEAEVTPEADVEVVRYVEVELERARTAAAAAVFLRRSEISSASIEFSSASDSLSRRHSSSWVRTSCSSLAHLALY